MSRREDHHIIDRGIRNRTAETLLLIIGLSLGIGASSAGMAMVIRTGEISDELLSAPLYREILVSTRQSSGEMDVPLMIHDDDREVVLTTIDLQAANDAPSIAYGYVKQSTVFRNTTSIIKRPESSEAGEDFLSSSRAHREEMTAQLGPDAPTVLLTEWQGYLVSPEFFPAWGLYAGQGSLFSLDDIRDGRKYMVIGSELAGLLFDEPNFIGQNILAGPDVYEIVGILEPAGTSMDYMAFAPAFMPDAAQNIQSSNISAMQSRWNTTLSFIVEDPGRLEQAADQLEAYFSRAYGPGSVIISIPRAEAEALRDRNSRIGIIILFLAAAGLLIAAVNVSNILLGRAMRKQKTIGILKALGASRNKIFYLFFREAFMIGIYGTILGIGVSYLAARLIQTSAGLGEINILTLALGIASAWVITTLLTIFPALQASKIPASEAMRTE